MNLSFRIYIIFIVIIFTACEKTVRSYKPETPKLQVISSIQSMDSVANCIITRTNDLNDINLNYLDNASVFLYDHTNILIDTLKNYGNGIYRGKVYLQTLNQPYRIVSTVDNYPVASCNFEFPKSTDFDIVNFTFNDNDPTILDPDLKPLSICNLKIKDKPEENFYMLQCFLVDSIPNQTTNQYRYIYEKREVSSNNLAVKSECTSNMVLNEELIYFSDKTFNGSDFSFDFGIPTTSSTHYGLPKKNNLILVVLKTISKDYYNFLKTFCNQENAQGYSGEGISYIYNLYPYASVYSNIKNGTGIWACYTDASKKIVVEY